MGRLARHEMQRRPSGTLFANCRDRRGFLMKTKTHKHARGPDSPKWVAAALLASLLLVGFVPRRASGQTDKQPSLWSQHEQGQRELTAVESQREQSQRELLLREAEQKKLVEQIENLKAQPNGPVRDLRLESLLAQAKDRADALTRQAQALQKQSEFVTLQQQKLLRLDERILAGEDGPVDSGKRVLLLRLRAQLSERLYADAPERLRVLTQASAALEQKTPQVDDPQGLRDRADLLRDSADKLLREMAKLKDRRQALVSRQRVRQRAATVDEDLFAEQATARRTGASFGGRETKLADAAATAPSGPPIPGPVADTTPPASTAALRTSLDPATLDALLRSDGSGDASQQAAALQRAEAELRSLAEQLQRRATQLEQRAAALPNQK